MDAVIQSLKRQTVSEPSDLDAWKKYAIALERLLGHSEKKQYAVLGQTPQTNGIWGELFDYPSHPVLLDYQESDDFYVLFEKWLEGNDCEPYHPDDLNDNFDKLNAIEEIWILDESIKTILAAMYRNGTTGNDSAGESSSEDANSLCRNLATRIIVIEDDQVTRKEIWKKRATPEGGEEYWDGDTFRWEDYFDYLDNGVDQTFCKHTIKIEDLLPKDA